LAEIAIFSVYIHQYSKLSTVRYNTKRPTYYFTVITAAELKNVRSCKMWFKSYTLVCRCGFRYYIHTSCPCLSRDVVLICSLLIRCACSGFINGNFFSSIKTTNVDHKTRLRDENFKTSQEPTMIIWVDWLIDFFHCMY
jgi:hypothetical protein